MIFCRVRLWPKDVLFHIRFGFDRTPFRRMHAALWAATQEPVLRMLAPSRADAYSEASSMVRRCKLPTLTHAKTSKCITMQLLSWHSIHSSASAQPFTV